MKKTLLEKTADKLVNAFVNNKIIAPLPAKFTKKLGEAQKLRKLCESKVKDPIIGFKAAGTGIPVMKKLKEKKPFYAAIFKKNFIKSGKKVKINKSTLGIELEVCYLIKKNFFSSKRSITMKNVTKYISYMAPCIVLLVFGLALSIILMATAATVISRWINEYKWIAWIGLIAILVVAIELIYTDLKLFI